TWGNGVRKHHPNLAVGRSRAGGQRVQIANRTGHVFQAISSRNYHYAVAVGEVKEFPRFPLQINEPKVRRKRFHVSRLRFHDRVELSVRLVLDGPSHFAFAEKNPAQKRPRPPDSRRSHDTPRRAKRTHHSQAHAL